MSSCRDTVVIGASAGGVQALSGALAQRPCRHTHPARRERRYAQAVAGEDFRALAPDASTHFEQQARQLPLALQMPWPGADADSEPS